MTRSTPMLWLLISVLASWNCECLSQSRPQTSFRQGIQQTQQSLGQVDKLLEENQTALLTLQSKVLNDLAADNPLKDAVDVFKVGANGFKATTAFQNQDYLQGIGQTAEAIAAVWGNVNPPLEAGVKLIDAAADWLEFQSLLNQQVTLLRAQLTLQQQLLRQEGKDPNTLAQWQQILNNLQGDPSTAHQAFLQWLAAHGLSQSDVVAKALADASSKGTVTASQVASGMTILDPNQDLSTVEAIPGINPDFIAALKANFFIASHASDPRWLRYTATTYPDGTYIPAFGPCKGIDIPNPISGGLISSSTAQCSSKTSRASGNDKYAQSARVRVQWNGINAVRFWIGTSLQATPRNETRIEPGQSVTIPFWPPGQLIFWMEPNVTQKLASGKPIIITCWPLNYSLGERRPHFELSAPAGQIVSFAPPVGQIVLRRGSYQPNDDIYAQIYEQSAQDRSAQGALASCSLNEHTGPEESGDFPAGNYIVALRAQGVRAGGSGSTKRIEMPITISPGESTVVVMPTLPFIPN
jgi:hypothetical protein